MKNSDRSFKLAHFLGIALLVGLLSGSVFAAMPVSAQAVVPVPGPARTVTVVLMNEGGDQTDPHVSGDWVAYTDNSVYRIRFQNLDPFVWDDDYLGDISFFSWRQWLYSKRQLHFFLSSITLTSPALCTPTSAPSSNLSTLI